MSIERTTVMEMRALVTVEHEAKLTPAKVDRYPFRDIDRLREALRDSASTAQAATRFGCDEADVVEWARIYGLDTDALTVEVPSDV